MLFGKKTPARVPFIQRAFRSLISIVVLSAFVLGLTFFVREASTLNTKKLITFASPVLSKLGLSEQQVGEVAGAVASRVLNTSISASNNTTVKNTTPTAKNLESVGAITSGSSAVRRTEVLKVALMSDSEDDNAALQQALFKAKELGITTVFYLGDLTQLGTIESLQEAKTILDKSGLTYYAIPGDHDLYKSVGPQNFEQVFGVTSTSVVLSGNKIVLFDNSANYTLISNEKMAWFAKEITDADFVILSQPIYHPTPSVLSPIMGLINGDKDEKVYAQRGELLDLIQKSKVLALFAGDHHRSSTYSDATDKDLMHYVVGALNDSKKLQSARFSVLTVYDTNEYEVSEILLDL